MRWAQSLESLLAMGFSQFLPALLPNLEAEMLLLDQIDGKVPRKLNTVRVLAPGSSNQHESLSGIETKCNPRHPRPKHGSNKHESLSGIETNGKDLMNCAHKF